MSIVVNVAVPVFGIMLAGAIAARTGLLGVAAADVLNRFVYWFAMPVLLFVGMARAPLSQTFNPNFMGTLLVGTALVVLLGIWIGRLFGARGAVPCMQALSCSFSNTGYMGIPLFYAAFGHDGIAPAVLGTVLMGFMLVGIGVIWMEMVARHDVPLHRAVWDALKAVLRNPLMMSSAVGVVWAATLGAEALPAPLVTFCELLGGAAGPSALFAIGLFLASRPFPRAWGELAWISAVKLLVHPAIAWVLIHTLFPLEPFWAASAIILSALPTGGTTFVLAQAYDTHAETVSATILVSTILSLPIISAILAVYAPH